MEGDDFLEESEDDDDDLATATDFFCDNSFADCLEFNVSLLLTTPRELDRLFFSTLLRGGDLIFSSVMERLLAVFTIGVL